MELDGIKSLPEPMMTNSQLRLLIPLNVSSKCSAVLTKIGCVNT